MHTTEESYMHTKHLNVSECKQPNKEIEFEFQHIIFEFQHIMAYITIHTHEQR